MTSAVRDALAQVGGFHVLPVRAGDGTDAPFRHLYFKRDERPKDGEEESAPSASLFVINVPADSTEGDLKRLFGVAGKIKSVVMSDSKDFSTRHCTVIFDKPTSVDRAISLPLSKWGNPVLAADHALVDSTVLCSMTRMPLTRLRVDDRVQGVPAQSAGAATASGRVYVCL